MSSIYTIHGVVLKRKIYGENDKFITFYTSELGKITVLAKGIRKINSRRSGHVEVFSKVNCSIYKGKTFDYLAEVVSIVQLEQFHVDLRKTSAGYYLCELIDRLLPERQEHSEIYEILNNSLQVIAKSTSDEERYHEMYLFALEILRILGFLPETETISKTRIHGFIESVIERKLHTLKLLEKID